MKKAVIIVCTFLMFSFLAGCGQATPEEQYLSHWEKIVSLLTENKADTAKAQAALKSYLDAHLVEMNALAGQFGKEDSKKIAQNTVYINRILKLVDAINGLEKTNKALLDDPQVVQILTPLLTAASAQ